jgi:nicotinamidase-related amidase
LALSGADAAIANAARLLAAARNVGAKIFHVAHRGRPGGLFDRAAARGGILPALAPLPGEPVIEKELPNAFAGTDLKARLDAAGHRNIVLAGFMTHMCVSSTARAALDLGFRGIIPAATIHDVALVELSDRFALIARDQATLI